MIRIFKGYEIDGSDTSFYLMTDKKERIAELIEFILKLPIFDRALPFQIKKVDKDMWAPHRAVYSSGKFLYEDIDKYIEQIKTFAENSQDFFVNLPCQITVLLDNNIKKELEQYTETRPGGMHENMGMQNPEGDLERGAADKYVSVNVSFKKELRVDYENIYDNDEEENPENINIDKNGMVLNRESYEQLLHVPVFTISLGCGPGFYYEYAAWIMNKIADKFHDIGIDGGLDCGGAFTGGCTYADTIYAFERIELPWKKASYAIEQLLLDHIEIYKQRPAKKLKKVKSDYYGNDWYVLVNPIKTVQQKFLDNQAAFDYFDRISVKENIIKAKDYQEFCDFIFSSDNISNEEMISATAVKMLTRPDAPLNSNLNDWEYERDVFLRTCYIVACRNDRQRSCEIWLSKDAAEGMRKKLADIRMKK